MFRFAQHDSAIDEMSSSGYQKFTMAIRQRRAANSEVIKQSLSRPLSVAITLLVVSVFINYVDRGNLSIAAPLLKNELGLSASQLGILFSAFFWTYTAMLFVCGWFVDRFDPSRVLALGYLVWSLSTAATGLVHGFAMLLLMRLFLGMGESVAFPCYSKILARHVPEHSRGFANGAIIAGMKLGPAAGTLGAGLLMANYGWRPVFLGIGLVSLVWLPTWVKWMPSREAPAHSAGPSPRVIDILRKRPFWATAAGAFCCAYPLYFTITWLPFYLVHEQHLSLQDMVKIAALYYTVDAAAALATGWVTDFWIRRGLAVGLMRKTAMALGWATAAGGFFGCSSAGPDSYLVWLMVAAVGLGTGNANIWAFTQTLAGPRAVGRWAGLQNGFGNLAGVIGPALTGFIVDWTGHFQVAIEITAAVCLLGALVWLLLLGEFKEVAWAQPAGALARPVEFI
jgi:ACS family D-galactonate transporter-like MFS transporter